MIFDFVYAGGAACGSKHGLLLIPVVDTSGQRDDSVLYFYLDAASRPVGTSFQSLFD